MDVDYLSGRAFETICPGYNAEATLSAAFSINALQHTQTSKPVLIANHLKWQLYISHRRDKEVNWLVLTVKACNGEVPRYPMSFSVGYTLEANHESHRFKLSTVRHNYDEYSFGGIGEYWMPYDVVLNNRDKFEVDGKITVTAELNVSLPICYNFDVPNSFSDVTIKIGDVLFPFNKIVLAVHSSFFNAMFFGSFKEYHDSEVTLEDVNVVCFVKLINLLFVRSFELKMISVASVLKLADRFGMLAIVDHCEKLMIKCELNTEPCLAERLVLATTYSLKNLQKRCLELCTSTEIIKNVTESPFYKELHSDGKAVLLDRIVKLLPPPVVPVQANNPSQRFDDALAAYIRQHYRNGV